MFENEKQMQSKLYLSIFKHLLMNIFKNNDLNNHQTHQNITGGYYYIFNADKINLLKVVQKKIKLFKLI